MQIDTKQHTVNIFVPCFVDQFFPNTGINLVNVLSNVGCSVNYNVEQTCCGMPAFQDGFWDHSRDVAKKLINEYDDSNSVVCIDGACSAMVKKSYTELFKEDILQHEVKKFQKRFFEFSDFMVNELGVTDVNAVLEAKAVYMDACKAVNACGIYEQPRKLLANVRGLKLIELNDDTCCGFGGTFAAENADFSDVLATSKADLIYKSGAEVVISSDMSCLYHVQQQMKGIDPSIRFMHIVDVLAQKK
ncbi:MAG: (Fe-S)-binding protein [Bacteroidia bacterium]|nr:(Fe-S)-binding protein [Bacteroidia bacterium]NNM15617.1 (Fe-S)-binding protein [Bacteroidia bacterium]